MSGVGEDMEFDEVLFGGGAGSEDPAKSAVAPSAAGKTRDSEWKPAAFHNHGGRGARPVAVGKSSPASTPETTSSSAGSWRTAAGRNIPSSGLTAGTIGSGSSSLKETSFTPAAAAASAAAGSGEPASQIPASPAEDPTAPNDTIVIKNLPYALTKEDIEKYLVSLTGDVPETIRLFTDADGNFRGIAFVKYSTTEEGVKAYAAVEGESVMGRKVRVEYRKPPSEDRRSKNPAVGPSSLPASSSMARAMGGRLGGARNSPFGSPTMQPQSQPLKSVSPQVPKESTGPDLDLTDAYTREVLDKVKDFYDNPRVSALSFPPNLTAQKVVVVLQVAESFRLDSQYVDEAGVDRYLQLCKRPLRGSAPSGSSIGEQNQLSRHSPVLGTANSGNPNSRAKAMSISGGNSKSPSASFTSPRLAGLSAGGGSSFGAGSGSFKEGSLPRSWNAASAAAASRVRAGSRGTANQRIARGPDGAGFFAGRGKPLSRLLKPGPPMTEFSLNAEEFVPPSRRLQVQSMVGDVAN